MDGYELLQKEGLAIPQSVKDATAQYQHNSDKLQLFIDECMEQGDYEEKTSTIYLSYRNWCIENGHYAESMRNFKQSLDAIVPVVRKRPKVGGEKTTMVTGYRLLPDFLK